MTCGFGPNTGVPLGLPLEVHFPTSAFAFSPDSRTVLLASGHHSRMGYELLLCDVESGKHLWKRVRGMPSWGHQDIFASNSSSWIQFSLDGKTVVTSAETDKSWPTDMFNSGERLDAATGKAMGPSINPGDEEGSFGPAIGPTINDETPTIQPKEEGSRPDDATGEPMAPPMQDETPMFRASEVLVGGFINHPAIDANVLLTSTGDNRVGISDAATHEAIGTFPVPMDRITSVLLSPDRRIVLIGEHRTPRLWNVTAAKPIGGPLEQEDEIMAMTFSPDGRTLLIQACTQLSSGTLRPPNPSDHPCQTQERAVYACPIVPAG